MKRTLHILTRPEDALAAKIISQQKTISETAVDTADLTQPNPDYKALLKKVFAADSVQVW